MADLKDLYLSTEDLGQYLADVNLFFTAAKGSSGIVLKTKLTLRRQVQLTPFAYHSVSFVH